MPGESGRPGARGDPGEGVFMDENNILLFIFFFILSFFLFVISDNRFLSKYMYFHFLFIGGINSKGTKGNLTDVANMQNI